MFNYLKNKNGIALLSVIAVMGVLLVIGSLLLKLASLESSMVHDYGNEIRSFYIAEAGADLAAKKWGNFLGECSSQNDITEGNFRQYLENAADISGFEEKFENSYETQSTVNIYYTDFELTRDEKEVTFKAVGEYEESYSDREITLSYDFFNYFNPGIADELYELYNNIKSPKTLESNEELKYNPNSGKLDGIKNDKFYYSTLFELKKALKKFFEPEHKAWSGNLPVEINNLSEGDKYNNLGYTLTLFGTGGRKVFLEGNIKIEAQNNKYNFHLPGNEKIVGVEPEKP